MDPGQRAAVFVWVFFFVFLWLIQNCILAWNVTDWDVFRYRLLPNVFISPTSVVVNRASKPKFKRRNRFWTVDVIYRCSAFLHLPGLNVFKLPSRCTCFILSSWTSPNKAWHDGAWLGTCLKSQYSRLVVCWVVFEMDACIVFILMQKYFVLSDGGFFLFCFLLFCFFSLLQFQNFPHLNVLFPVNKDVRALLVLLHYGSESICICILCCVFVLFNSFLCLGEDFCVWTVVLSFSDARGFFLEVL